MRLATLAAAFLIYGAATAQEPAKAPPDVRLGPPKTYDPKFDAKKQFLWTPPTTKEE